MLRAVDDATVTNDRPGAPRRHGTRPPAVRGSAQAHDSLVRACALILTLRKVPYFRLNQRPARHKDGHWSSPGADPGAPDIMAIWRGVFLFIECKTGEARQSPMQRREAAKWEAQGARVLIIHNATELDRFIQMGRGVSV